MADERSWTLERITQLLVPVVVFLISLAAIVLTVFVVIEVTGSSQFDPDRVTIGAVAAGALVVVAAIALPAYLLSSWQSEREEIMQDQQ